MNTSTQSSTRWLAVGRSDLVDASEAGSAAAREAMLGRESPRLLLVFASDSYALQDLLGGIGSHAGDVPVIGCSTAGEIATHGPGNAGVVVVALGGTGFTIAVEKAEHVAGRLRLAAAEAAGCITGVADREHRVLLMLSDGLAGDQQEVVRGAYSIVGAAVPLVGGCAGDDLKMHRTFQFFNGAVLEDAIVVAAIGSDAPLGIGVRHGWRQVGEPMAVTRSEGNRVFTLNDEPALDRYLERLGAPLGAHTDPAAFTQFAMTHPFGLNRRRGTEVRFIAGANFADRSINCIAEVPQGAQTWLMEGDDGSVLAATDAACADALASLKGAPPAGFIVFDCIARKGVLGEPGIKREVARIGDHAAGAPVAGFYTYGEFARTRGSTGFHNQTLVVLAVS